MTAFDPNVIKFDWGEGEAPLNKKRNYINLGDPIGWMRIEGKVPLNCAIKRAKVYYTDGHWQIEIDYQPKD